MMTRRYSRDLAEALLAVRAVKAKHRKVRAGNAALRVFQFQTSEDGTHDQGGSREAASITARVCTVFPRPISSASRAPSRAARPREEPFGALDLIRREACSFNATKLAAHGIRDGNLRPGRSRRSWRIGRFHCEMLASR